MKNTLLLALLCLILLPCEALAWGGRNHATVLHSCKAVSDMMDTDKVFKSQIEEIDKIVLGKN